MKFIRKYSALLIPIGIIFVSVLIFIPTILMGHSLRNEIEQGSVSQGDTIGSMVRKAPSSEQYEIEKQYQAQQGKDADGIAQLAKQSSQRMLISYKIFPEPKGISQQRYVDFGKDYRSAIEKLVKSMNALDAPSESDIQKETNRKVSGARGARKRTTKRGKAGQQEDSTSIIIDAVCQKRAESIQVYANPNLFNWYGFWDDYEYIGSSGAIKDCWHSQVSYWIYQDVVATINSMNTGFEDVLTSPVKRLIGVSFEGPVEYQVQRRGEVSLGREDKPIYVSDEEVQILGVKPWTGRIGNAEIDVVHFSVGVVLESREFMSFIKELCSEKEHLFREGYQENGLEKLYKHNQITVLKSEINPIVPDSENHKYYRYGDGASVEVMLVCEYVFNRGGYDVIKPKSIKELLDQGKKSDEPKSKSKKKKSSRKKSSRKKKRQ